MTGLIFYMLDTAAMKTFKKVWGESWVT